MVLLKRDSQSDSDIGTLVADGASLAARGDRNKHAQVS